jgi:hypothetical protein
MLRRLLLAALLAAVLQLPSARADEFAAECEPAATSDLVVGAVACRRLQSAFMGGTTAFSYYVPRACGVEGRRCPVLFYTHGTGGSYREGTGAVGTRGAWVRALASGPPVDPSHVADPWNYSDPNAWIELDPIDMIIISPQGTTIPGGNGPAQFQDTGWFDWNPRYARGGDAQQYDTPPPRAHSFLTKELVPYVDARFPTGGTREWRAIVGYSQGGFGSYINGFLSPDLFASMGMDSGGTLPVGDVNDIGPTPPVGIGGAGAYATAPGLVSMLACAPLGSTDIVSETVCGFGDPIADQVWLRASNPADLAPNVRASAGGVQSVHLRHMVGDAVPRRTADFENPQSYASQQVFESLLFPMNLYLERIFDRLGVERDFEVHPGLHSGVYRRAFFRQQLAAQYARLRHWDGSGSPLPWPATFDYRTVERDFTIWSWSFHVDRAATEFLNLTDVTCRGLTLRGTGVVTVTIPVTCGGGMRTVDLGPSHATDEMAFAGSSNAYGNTVHVDL